MYRGYIIYIHGLPKQEDIVKGSLNNWKLFCLFMVLTLFL